MGNGSSKRTSSRVFGSNAPPVGRPPPAPASLPELPLAPPLPFDRGSAPKSLQESEKSCQSWVTWMLLVASPPADSSDTAMVRVALAMELSSLAQSSTPLQLE